MLDKNICKFVPIRNCPSDLITINFVYEKTNFANDFLLMHSYSINIAVKSEGILHTKLGSFKIKKGNLFLSFAGQQFYVENKGDFEYIYITFIGTRANALMERLKIDFRNPVLPDNDQLIDIWKNALSISNDKNIDLISEGILLYTLSYICNTY